MESLKLRKILFHSESDDTRKVGEHRATAKARCAGKNKARISTSQSIVVVWFAIVVPPIRNTLDRTRLCVCPNSHAEVLNEFYYVRILWEQVPVEVKGGPPTLVTMDIARERYFEFYNSDQFVVSLKRNDFKFWVKVG